MTATQLLSDCAISDLYPDADGAPPPSRWTAEPRGSTWHPADCDIAESTLCRSYDQPPQGHESDTDQTEQPDQNERFEEPVR